MALFLEPILACKNYKPKFGDSQKENGFSLDEFRNLYGSDPFYSWIGLDSPLMYSAHKAAGGMTSIYRQVGIGCEYLFRRILVDTAEYSNPEMASWSYTAKSSSGKEKQLSLDGRLAFSDINNKGVHLQVKRWLSAYCKQIKAKVPKNGIVFEVRQGYKSKDSKRQNADIDNATVAWANGFLPVFVIFSSQIDRDIVLRYRNNRCGILIGSSNLDESISLFAFCKNILGFNLADFFQRNSRDIKRNVNEVLKVLLSPES
jgi:hypothetical protein